MAAVEQRRARRIQSRAGAGSWGAADIQYDGVTMAERGRPKKERAQLVEVPKQFSADDEYGLTEMQTAFVWHYTQGGCGQTEAARKSGFSFPAMSASRMMNGRDHPKVIKAIRAEQEELRQKFAITPEKTGSMLWKIAETSFENGAYNAAVSAVKELNQLAGLTIQRSQNLNINANLDSMTKSDIKSRLNELLGVQDEMKDNDV